ncbi:MAG: hypothetical protein ACRDFS_05880 [Chloroflexota bacterium]
MEKGPKLVISLTAALGLAAALEQWQQPSRERTWHGYILGVPYEFRPPTADRIRRKVWNPDNVSVLSPTVWGLGWTFNLYPLFHPQVTDRFDV